MSVVRETLWSMNPRFGCSSGLPLAGAGRVEHAANRRDDGTFQSRQIDDEDASPVRQIARVDPATVRLDTQPAEGEAQAQPGFYRHFILDRHHDECDAFGIGLQRCGGCEFGDECGQEELLAILHAMRQADLGERLTTEIACSQRASMEDPRGTPSDSDVPCLEYVECNNRSVEQVPQFMSEELRALVSSRGLAIESELISLTSVLRNRAGDGIVKASDE